MICCIDRRVLRSLAFVIGIAAIASCSPYDPTLGAEPFFCGSADPKCPDGYMCMPPTAIVPMSAVPSTLSANWLRWIVAARLWLRAVPGGCV